VYELTGFFKTKKKYRRYYFTNVGITTIINRVKYEMSSYQNI
jgi:hypothetical protein